MEYTYINISRPGEPLVLNDLYRIKYSNGTLSDTKTYGKTVISRKSPLRKISIGSFRRRLTLEEKVAIKISQDPIVQVLSEDLLASSYVDLDFPEVIQGLTYLTITDPVILTPERVVELLSDGKPEEEL